MSDDFREIPPHQLDRMPDEQLLAYMAAAHSAARERAIKDALWRLVDRYQKQVFAKILNKLPYTARAEEITQDVFEAAVKAVLDGKTIDHFGAWIFRVAANKIADFWRSPEGQQLIRDRTVGSGADDDDGFGGGDGMTEAGYEAVDLDDLVESIMSGLSELHRKIVDAYVFDDRTAAEVAEETGASEANVYQVAKRFRVELRRRLDNPDVDTGAGS